MDKNNRFYVYALLDPRKPGRYEYNDICFLWEPFYIGKGTGTRISQHTSPKELNRKRNEFKSRKIIKILKENLKVIKIKLLENVQENKSLLIEKKYIKIIGRHLAKNGPLTNFDEGGKTSPKMTKALKLKISKTHKKKYKSGENIHPWLGKKHTEETKVKISQNHSDYWNGKKHLKKTIKKMKKNRKEKKILKMCNVYEFTSPSGEKIIVNNGIENFCKNNNLTYSCIVKVLRKEQSHHKQWKCLKIKNNNGGVEKSYRIISPINKEYVVSNGLKSFCIKNNLIYTDLIKVAKGQRNHHKGWRCEYL